MEPLISYQCGFQTFSTVSISPLTVPYCLPTQLYLILPNGSCWSSTHKTHRKTVYALVHRKSPFRDFIEEYRDLEKSSKLLVHCKLLQWVTFSSHKQRQNKREKNASHVLLYFHAHSLLGRKKSSEHYCPWNILIWCFYVLLLYNLSWKQRHASKARFWLSANLSKK